MTHAVRSFMLLSLILLADNDYNYGYQRGYLDQDLSSNNTDAKTGYEDALFDAEQEDKQHEQSESEPLSESSN